MTTNLNDVLRKSIAQSAIPHFQPIIYLDDDSGFAYEALGRLEHNGLILTPSQFLPRFEHTQHMAEFDRVILSRAIEQMANWIHIDDLDVRMHVNASADALVQSSYADEVELLLVQHNVPSENLTIEVVETCQFWKSSKTLQTMVALKQLGVKIAIDDFPCWSDPKGLVNWLELNSDKVDSIKIDQSLVCRACDDSISSGKLEELMRYIVMAHRLGLSVVAEGVRCEEDMFTMQLCEVDALQGFGIGKPQPADQFHQLSKSEEDYCFPSFTSFVPPQYFVAERNF